MPISDWLDLCPQTVVWKPLTGRDAFGKPTYGAATEYRGRRVKKMTRVRSQRNPGSDVIADSHVWILGLPDVKYEDAVYVSGDDEAKLPAILAVENYPDENGPLFMKVYFGSF